MFVCNVWIVDPDVALSVGSWSNATLDHFDLHAAVPDLIGPYVIITWLMLVLATDLAALEVDRFSEENTELLAALLRVELAMGQIQLLHLPQSARRSS